MIATQELQDIAGHTWPNPETRTVQMFLANKTEVMLHMREAARDFFRSPYCEWNKGGLLPAAAGAENFAEYARLYLKDVLRSKDDPHHDATEMLRLSIVELSLSRVDWDAISQWWHDAVAAECDIHGSQL
jgi:hypothetical protein